MLKKYKLFFIGILVITSIFSTSCSTQKSQTTNTQVSNNEQSQIENEIKNKIAEVDKIAQSGQYYPAYGQLRSVKVDENYKPYFSNHLELAKQIDTKLSEYDFKGHLADATKELDGIKTNKGFNFSDIRNDLIFVLKNEPQDEKVKKLNDMVLKNIKDCISQKGKYDYDIGQILTAMAVAYPENEDSYKKLYETNESFNERKDLYIPFKDSIDIATHTSEELYTESMKDVKKEPVIGMTKDEITNSTWGKPNHVNQTITASCKFEQWVYSDGKYVYFENGVVTSIQK